MIKSIKGHHNDIFETIYTEIWYFLSIPDTKICSQGPKVGPFTSLLAPILVTKVSQIDYKATKLVENECLWCPTTVSIKKMIQIEWTKPLKP